MQKQKHNFPFGSTYNTPKHWGGRGGHICRLLLVSLESPQQRDVHISCFIIFGPNGGNAIELNLECILSLKINLLK
jgi:hypothetical protein